MDATLAKRLIERVTLLEQEVERLRSALMGQYTTTTTTNSTSSPWHYKYNTTYNTTS